MSTLDQSWLSCLERNYDVASQVLMNRDIDTALHSYGVDASTIRAMPTGSDAVRPMSIFSEWAREQDSALGIATNGGGYTLSPTSTAKGLITDFASWHKQLASSMAAHWASRMKNVTAQERKNANGETYVRKQYKTLGVAHKYKLVDLYVRSLRLRVPHDSEVGRAIMQHANIPLDKKSIAVIEAILQMPKRSTTMGDIKTEQQYQHYQKLAEDICQQIQLPSDAQPSKLVFDTFAWHHPKAQAEYMKSPSATSQFKFVP
ncbi:hypothetical protein [Paraburkholderia caledonica]|jgi:hypothetical protein|uniref:hypothetical protein n=1 Tax=Paraburkholderia caledonica TaxID=134536 RepID=UPI00047F7AEA|nr:hypothetical protein [Paraburkholderia caledonica]